MMEEFDKTEEVTEAQSPAQKAAFAKMLAAKNPKKDEEVEESTEETTEEVNEEKLDEILPLAPLAKAALDTKLGQKVSNTVKGAVGSAKKTVADTGAKAMRNVIDTVSQTNAASDEKLIKKAVNRKRNYNDDGIAPPSGHHNNTSNRWAESTEEDIEENLKEAELQIKALKEDCSCGHGSDCGCGPECGCGCNSVKESINEEEEVYFQYDDIGGNIIVNPNSTIEDQIGELLHDYYDISPMEFDVDKIEIVEPEEVNVAQANKDRLKKLAGINKDDNERRLPMGLTSYR
jgi:hypothetical protein